MSAKHTPGTLQIQNGTDIFGPMGGVSAAGVVADANDAWHVADCNVGTASVNGELRELDWSEKQANARRFVLCWSAHDGLVAALQAIVTEADGPGKPHSGDSYLPDHFIKQARAALAKVEGEKSHE